MRARKFSFFLAELIVAAGVITAGMLALIRFKGLTIINTRS